MKRLFYRILNIFKKKTPTIQPTWEFYYFLTLDPIILKYQIDSYNKGVMTPRFALALEALDAFCNKDIN